MSWELVSPPHETPEEMEKDAGACTCFVIAMSWELVSPPHETPEEMEKDAGAHTCRLHRLACQLTPLELQAPSSELKAMEKQVRVYIPLKTKGESHDHSHRP